MNLNSGNLLKRYPLLFFFILAYGIAWISLFIGYFTGADFLTGVSFFSPAISAVIMTAVNEGKEGITALFSGLFKWRVKLKWYLIAILAPIVFELLALLTHRFLGDTTVFIHFTDWITTLPTQLPWLIIILLFLALTSSGEELGWRGYALQKLQVKYGSVWASIILGLIWGFWHLPTFWIPGSPQYGLPVAGYVLATIGYSFIYTCIFNGTKGSVLLVSLFHAASNLILTYGNAIFPQIIDDLYLSLPALAIVAVVVIMISGSKGFVGKQSLPNEKTA